ncbi:hypothetical protein [Edaphovirga cremea]|uniref:hypothetical protein n=1 Tax=Edaphovirga cremea TaxID=2267246 RepID=UPI003988B4AF
MNYEISAAIIKLKAEATGVVFTGFVTNAHVQPPAMLKGEVWGHVCADGFGTFADNHRIETSDITHIHVRGASMWVITQSGSVYGILSFTPLGWTYFADFYQAHHWLNPLPPGSATFHMSLAPNDPPGLSKRLKKEPRQQSVPLSRKELRRELRGPDTNTRYMDKMEVFIQETTKVLERNGMEITKHGK